MALASLGTIATFANTPLGRMLQSAVIGAIQQGTKTVLQRDSVPVDNDHAPSIAREVADAITPVVVNQAANAIANDPVLGKAMNAEPLAQSKNLWLAIAGVLGSAAAIATLVGNGNYDIAALSGSGMALITSLGIIWRRVRMGWRVQEKLSPGV